MPHIPLPEHLPGITGLLEYRLDTAIPIRELTQLLLRGESTLTPGERELIATLVSSRNCTRFCTAAHAKAADLLLGDPQITQAVIADPETAPISEKMKALLQLAAQTQQSGSAVTPETVERAHRAGATDREIHDTVLLSALFCLYNKYVDGMATVAPADAGFYDILGERIVNRGYGRPPGGYPAPQRTEPQEG
ncbi:carboxymuconolactone decarboxylase family protein [Spirosoma pomorum]